MDSPSTSFKCGQLLAGASLPDYGVFCNSEEFSDLKLTVGETTYFGHRIVLATASEVFQTMLSSVAEGFDRSINWFERDHVDFSPVWCSTSELRLRETGDCEAAFLEFLEFLYTWRVRLNEENVVPLALLSDKYLVKDLAALCVNYMVEEVCTENAIPWFRFSLKYNVERLFNECIRFISHNFEHFHHSGKLVELDTNEMALVLDSGAIVCKSEMDIIQAILKWMKAYDRPVQESLREDIVQLFSSVRTPMLTPADVDKIEKTKELQDFVMLLLPKFYLTYKYHSFGVGVPIPSDDKRFKNYVPRIYTERCGTFFVPISFWEHYFQTPSHMSAKHAVTLKWKYQNRKPDELELLLAPGIAQGMVVPYKLRVVRMTKRLRKGFKEVKIVNDTVNQVANFGPCIDMGSSDGYQNDIKTHGLMVAVLPTGLPG